MPCNRDHELTDDTPHRFDIPDYPEHTGCAEAADTRMRYDKVKGSAVNPVLREGNSDRRAPPAVKEFARANPHRMGKWSHESKTHVATMSDGDFRSNEKSAVMQTGDVLTIQHVREGGVVTPLKEGLAVQPGEVIDASIMEIEPLDAFLKEQIQDAKDKGVLFSLHMKATMMKVCEVCGLLCAELSSKSLSFLNPGFRPDYLRKGSTGVPCEHVCHPSRSNRGDRG